MRQEVSTIKKGRVRLKWGVNTRQPTRPVRIIRPATARPIEDEIGVRAAHRAVNVQARQYEDRFDAQRSG
jgi:hypothetical protein